MGILLLEVVVSIPPLGHGRAMPDHHCEVAIQQQHSVRSDRSHIQHDWLCLCTAHAVGLQRWLDHGDSITGGFSIQQHPAVGCLIWTVAKDLYSSSSVSQMGCMPCCNAAGALLTSAQDILPVCAIAKCLGSVKLMRSHKRKYILCASGITHAGRSRLAQPKYAAGLQGRLKLWKQHQQCLHYLGGS